MMSERARAWLIHFDDVGRHTEVFMGEGAEAAARARSEQVGRAWTHTLFVSAGDAVSDVVTHEAAATVRENIVCRVHRMPDCSPLLNGCSRLNKSHAALDLLVVRAGEVGTDPSCDACGSHDGTAEFRGWHDEGEPMRTCASCGSPDVGEVGTDE